MAALGELDISTIRERLTESSEFMRMWSSEKGQAFCIIEPQALGADPATFGIAMADAIRHAAKAWAQAVQVSEDHAYERIMAGFNAEIASPTDTPTQISGQPH